MIETAGGFWPDTAVMEIHTATGVPLDKLVIGKPVNNDPDGVG
jgi:hypothetical protein